MGLMIAGLVLFLGLHSVRIVADDWRGQFIQQRGAGLWKGLYSLLSLAGFVMICWGFGLARQQPVVLWSPPVGMRHVTALLMVLSLVLFLASKVPGNSIKAKLHHPMLLSVKVWAAAHLLANGSLADVLLFGSFLLWSVACYVASRRRDRQAGTVYAAGRIGPTWVTLVAGLLLYGLMVGFGHKLLIGVPIFS